MVGQRMLDAPLQCRAACRTVPNEREITMASDSRAHSLPELRENEAPPDVSAIYADMRQVMRLPLVNLIWRHLATLPGVLPWAWRVVREPLDHGYGERIVQRLASTRIAPHIVPFDNRTLSAAGIGPEERLRIGTLLAVYHRGNSLNLAALSAVLLEAEGVETPPDNTAADAMPSGPVPAIPPLPRLGDLDLDTAQAVQKLAALHDLQNGVVPSLYLHLATWPGLLAPLRATLDPLFPSGWVAATRDAAVVSGKAEALRLLAHAPKHEPPPAPSLPAIRSVITAFRGKIIPEMIAVGAAIEMALNLPT